MKKPVKVIRFMSPFTHQEMVFVVSDELSRNKEKIHNCAFVRRKVERTNEFFRSLSPERLAILGLSRDPENP